MELRSSSEPIRDRPIGVFDSGLGGLTVVKSLRRKLKEEDIVYLGDTARVPYGTKSDETIKRFAREDVEFLKNFDVKLIVVACHTASSVALDYLKQEFEGVPFIGVVEPAVSKALSLGLKRVGIIGTQATIESRIHKKLLFEEGDIEVYEKACPLFVPLVEEGITEGPIAEKVVEYYLKEMRGKIDSLILACTHYPLLKAEIGKFLKGVELIDPSCEVAAAVESHLTKRGERKKKGKGKLEIYLTDMPRDHRTLIENFLGELPELVKKVELVEV